MPNTNTLTLSTSVAFSGLWLLIFSSILSAQSFLDVQHLSTFRHGAYMKSASEIIAHDPVTQRLYVVNAQNACLDVLDIRDPAEPRFLFKISAARLGKGINSVDIHGNLLAVAVEDSNKQAPGRVAFYDTGGRFFIAVQVGVLPDMVKFSPDGRWVLSADEGEPSSDYRIDPEGSVTIIDLREGIDKLTQDHVRLLDFRAFNGKPLDPRIRVFGPNATPAQDFEPEYIAISADSKTAWVVLQENNAMVVVDIEAGVITDLIPFGYKNHNVEAQGLDASDADHEVDIRTWPVFGMYQPDAITAIEVDGETYLITANEGDPRVYDAFQEEVRIADIPLDPQAFPKAKKLQNNKRLGRLKVSKVMGDPDADGDYDALYAFGGRSFAVWTARGDLLFDSGDDFEGITALALPRNFNSNNEKNGSFDQRSDDRGPEPEGLTIGKINGKTYLFVGLERVGGVMIYDISQPARPHFVDYFNPRNFSGNATEGTAGDLGPEGLTFISAANSPAGVPLLVVANEVSGTTSIFAIRAYASEQSTNAAAARRVAFALQKPAAVAIDLVDSSGNRVAKVVNARFQAGQHEVTLPAHLLSGTYFCRISIDGMIAQIRRLHIANKGTH